MSYCTLMDSGSEIAEAAHIKLLLLGLHDGRRTLWLELWKSVILIL